MSRLRSLPLGAWLAFGLALAVALPAVAAGATWLTVGARQQSGMEARLHETSALLQSAAPRLADPEVRSSVLRGLAALEVEADVQAAGFKPGFVTPAKDEKLVEDKLGRPLRTKQLAVLLSQPDGKRTIGERFETHEVTNGPITGTLFVARPSAAVRLAATCAAGLLALALALIAGLVLLRRWVVRPLARLAADAGRIAGGDLDVAPVTSRTREVAEVGTALRGMAEGLRGALAERDAAEQQRRFLVGAIAHDLRTPLFTLRGSLEAIERGIGNGDQLRRAQDKATLIDRLVGDLFTFSRLENDEPHLQLERLDAGTLARDAADIVDAGIELDVPPATPALRGDRAALLRVLVNLLDNAMRHADSTVWLRVLTERDDVLFAVEDDGPGIAATDLPQLFDPLFRADRARNSATGGAGLGLAIVQRLTTAHGGSVSAENRADGGARFVVRLPRSERPGAPSTSGSPSEQRR